MHAGVEHDGSHDEFVRRTARGAVAGAPQDGANARHQFARIERLAEVVVGAEFQPTMRSTSSPRAVSIKIGVAYEAPSLRSTSKPPTVGSITSSIRISNSPDLQFLQRVAAVVHALDVEMLGFQVLGEHLTQFAVVVDQQHARLPCAADSRRLGWGCS
jgi:hypothetical protein